MSDGIETQVIAVDVWSGEVQDVIAQTIAHVRRWNAGEFMLGYPSDDDVSMARAVLRAIETGEAQMPGKP